MDEIRKALDALEAALAKGFKPDPTKKDPPAELAALRAALEAADRKGENVNDVRKQLDAVEMKLVGRVLATPKPIPPVEDPDKPAPFIPPVRPPFPGGDFPGIPPRLLLPDFGGGIDPAAIQQAQDLMRKAMEMRLKEPNDEEARKLLDEARAMMMKAMAGGQGRFAFPDAALGRAPDRFRLGIRMERLTPILVEQLGLEPNRGIAVADVMAGSPAEKAGFKPNDIVLEFAGKPVSDVPEEFTQKVNDVKAGEKLDAVVLRKGKKTEVKGIELPEAGRRLPGADRPRLVPPLPVPKLDGENGRLPDVRGGKGGIAAASNGNFMIEADQAGVKYSIRGTTENGKMIFTEITIDDDGTVHKADTLEKVPDDYRAAVEKLLKNVRTQQ